APRFIIGDGRIEMAKLQDEKFDLIVLDAFSSDTIPTHLLTYEALEEYKKRLTERGILLVNISNRYFNLAPILFKNSEKADMVGRVRVDRLLHTAFTTPSFWAAFARHENTLKPLDHMDWVNMPVPKDLRP